LEKGRIGVRRQSGGSGTERDKRFRGKKTDLKEKSNRNKKLWWQRGSRWTGGPIKIRKLLPGGTQSRGADKDINSRNDKNNAHARKRSEMGRGGCGNGDNSTQERGSQHDKHNVHRQD